MSHLSLMLLGTPVITYADQIITFRTRKALALLVYLAVERGLHAREALATLLWPESEASQGRATLRSTLAYLRRALAEAKPPATSAAAGAEESYLIVERDFISFNAETSFEADWLALQAAWSQIRHPAPVSVDADPQQPNPNPLLAQLQTTAQLYRGDFLTGFSLDDAPDFDDWASLRRETCHRQMGLVFDRLSQGQAEAGELHNAIETTTRWASLDPLNEAAHRRLMQLHFAAEDRAAALRAYETCRSILARELNAQPAPETEALADRLRAGDFPQPVAELQRRAQPTLEAELHNRPAPDLPLVGRANEHLALVTAYRAMRRGQPQGVVLTGEPGIGKTRLAKEFLGWATAQGADILLGRAFETGSRLPYQPIVEALRDRLERENAPDDLLPDLWLVELSRLLPELRERYPDLPAPATEEATARARLFEAVARLGQALAQRNPLILFLDDWHWADTASLDLLHYAARRWAAVGSPVLLLFTLRPEELRSIDPARPRPALSDWLMAWQQDIALTRLTLESLTLADIQRLVETLVTLPASTRTDFSQRLFAETAGHPFYLIETLKMLFEGSGPPVAAYETERLDLRLDYEAAVNRYLDPSDPGVTPPSVQEMIGARLARLSPPAQTACLAAAVLGDHFDFERLRRVADLDESESLAALEELLRRGLVREQRQIIARPYVLAHDRFREVVYQQASQPRRQILHRRAFEVLAAGTAPPAELARHAWAAGLSAQALACHVAAGEEAMQLYAPQAAIDHFTSALEVARQAGLTPELSLYRSRGRAYETVGDFEAAQADFQRVLTEARAQGDRPNEWQALQDLGFLWASSDYEQAGHYFRQALTLARDLSEPGTLACSLNRVGNWHANVEQPAEALSFHQEALAIFEASPAERAGQAETLDLLGMAHYMIGDMPQSLVCYSRAIDLFRELDHRRGLVSSLSMSSMVMRATFTVEVPPETDPAQCLPLAESAVQLAREIGWRAGESHALLALGQNLLHQGHYGAALAAIRDGLSVAVEIEHPLWTTYAHWALGLLHLDLLALPEAEQYLEQALRLASKTGSKFWIHISSALLSLTYTLQHEYDQASSILQAVMGPARKRLEAVDWPAQTAMQRLVWYARARLALACREPRLALHITEPLITATRHLSSERPALRLSALRGEALTALGRTAAAEASFREALGQATRQAEPPQQWRLHLALGRLYQAQEDPARAEPEFAAAEAIIANLATTVEEAAVRDIFRQQAMRLR